MSIRDNQKKSYHSISMNMIKAGGKAKQNRNNKWWSINYGRVENN